MKRITLKANWEKNLHRIRLEEIELIKHYLEKGFDRILEIGAGDGFQSQFLRKYCTELFSTDLNGERMKQISFSNVNYSICDAEELDQHFENDYFDLVFSSNVFEHLPHPQNALRGIKHVLKVGGYSINIMPNPFFDVSIILFHYPNYFLTKFERALNRLVHNNKKIDDAPNLNNNIKSEKSNSRLSKLLKLPKPHGINNSFIKEFKQFSKKHWTNLFCNEGFEVIDVIKGPIYSGYGFGFKWFKEILKLFKISSENIFIVKKISN